MDKKYNEYKVQGHLDKKSEFVIDKKEQTKRGHVMISERDAAVNNAQTRFNYLHYELAQESGLDSMKKDELIKYIQDNELEIDVNQNKSDLLNAIKEIEEKK